MLAMWGIALAIVIVQSDLGAALLYFLVFLALLYVATRRISYVVLGMVLFLVGGSVLYELVPHVQERIDIWINPFADRAGRRLPGHPRACTRMAGAASWARARRRAAVGRHASRRSRRSTPTSSSPRSPRSWACSARWRCWACTSSSPSAASASPRLAADDFRALLATGLTLVIVVQAAIIAGGNLRVLPLTGMTLPFISYGGSSLLVNGAVIGLLLALSDRGVEAPPPGARGESSIAARRRARPAVGGRVEEALS